MSCSKTNGVCYNASTEYNNVSVSTDPVSNTIVIESNMTLPEDDLFDTAIIIDSDEQMIITDTVDTSEIITHNLTTIMTLGTHDLQGISVASMSVINATTSRLCLQFTLVDGATTDTVHVALECDTRPTEIMSYTNDDELVFKGCIDTVANVWRLSGCDGPLIDNVTCPNPAITMTIVILPHNTTSTVSPVPTSTGIYTTIVPTSSSPGTVDILVPNMSLYSIVSSNTPTIPTAGNRGWVLGVVGGVIGVITLIMLIAVLGMSYYCIMFYTVHYLGIIYMYLLRCRYWYRKNSSYDIPLQGYNIAFDGKASVDNETPAIEAESSNVRATPNQPPTIDNTSPLIQQNNDPSTTEPRTTTTTLVPVDDGTIDETHIYDCASKG